MTKQEWKYHMKLSIRRGPRKTFVQLFTHDFIFWGIPMICLELIGVPILGWVIVLAMVVPATIIGVLAGVGIEYLLVSALPKGDSIEE